MDIPRGAEKILKIYEPLRAFEGIEILIQSVSDFEARRFAHDLFGVLASNGWKPRFVTEEETNLPEMRIREGISIFHPAFGKVDDAGLALWRALHEAFSMMKFNHGERPQRYVLGNKMSFFPKFPPGTSPLFVSVGVRATSSYSLEMQRRELEREQEAEKNRSPR